MSDKTLIEWSDATWNVITGCTIKSPGCRGCYAMKLAGTRLRNHPSRVGLTDPSDAGPVWNGKVRFNEQWLDQPQRWRKSREIFVCAHGDLFHESVPDAWIDQVFAVMHECPWHTFQVLTKRARRMREYMTAPGLRERIQDTIVHLHRTGKLRALDNERAMTWPLRNVIMMVSAERQQEFDERVRDLIATPAATRGLSLEPLLGPIDARPWLNAAPVEPNGSGTLTRKIDWVITGGESGDRARPSHPVWFRSLRDQCATAGVPFHFKQWGEWLPGHQYTPELQAFDSDLEQSRFESIEIDEEDGAVCGRNLHPSEQGEHHLWRVTKKRAGRLLDGVEHNGVPT